MTNEDRRTIEAMQALAAQDLEQAGEQQLREEFAEDGLDPAHEARRVAASLDAVVSRFMRHMASAARSVRAATGHPGPRPRPSIVRMKAAILDAFACEPQLAAAFRAGGRLTDADVRSLYDDLVAMGKIRS